MRKRRTRIKLKSRLEIPKPPKRSRKSAGSRRMATRSKIGWGVLLVLVMIVVNLWVFVWGGKSVRRVRQEATAAAIEKNPDRVAELDRRGKSLLDLHVPKALFNPEALRKRGSDGGDDDFADMETRILHGRIERGDSLYRAFGRLGVGRDVADSVVRALHSVYDFRRARPGQRFLLRISGDSKSLVDFEYHASPVKVYRVTRVGDRLVGEKVDRPVDTRLYMMSVRVRSNLYNALKEVKGDGRLLNLLVSALSHDMNFYTDIHAGDVMRLLIEKDFLDGKLYRYGRLLAVQYEGKSGNYEAYWYQCRNGTTGYYDGKGQALRREMLKTPLRYTRISSKFDLKRFHPILRRYQAHLGVDFAAPTGTPVWAAADGVVTFAGRNRAAGNMIVLDHQNGMVSIYMHLQRFRRGLSRGDEVRQRQVIGYVGSTGRSTGPHLHFGVKVNGQYVDPLKLEPRRADPVPKKEMSVYREIAGTFGRSLTSLPPPSEDGGILQPADEPVLAAVDVLNQRIEDRVKRQEKQEKARAAKKAARKKRSGG